MTDFSKARRNMVDGQLRTYEVTDRAIVEAFSAVAREDFVPESQRDIAYLDRTVVIRPAAGAGEIRELLTPMVHARLLMEAAPKPSERVLDIACGYGYSTAVLARLCDSVVGVESVTGYASEAKRRLAAAGISNASVVGGDFATAGAGNGQFDLIMVNGSFEVVPQGLIERLAPGGRLAGIKGHGRAGQAVLLLKSRSGVAERPLFDAYGPSLVVFNRAKDFVF